MLARAVRTVMRITPLVSVLDATHGSTAAEHGSMGAPLRNTVNDDTVAPAGNVSAATSNSSTNGSATVPAGKSRSGAPLRIIVPRGREAEATYAAEVTASVVDAKGEWEILSVNPMGDEVYATPAIADGRIYLRTKSALYAFAAAK